MGGLWEWRQHKARARSRAHWRTRRREGRYARPLLSKNSCRLPPSMNSVRNSVGSSFALAPCGGVRRRERGGGGEGRRRRRGRGGGPDYQKVDEVRMVDAGEDANLVEKIFSAPLPLLAGTRTALEDLGYHRPPPPLPL
eukprot:746524-Hanusia_phi.AAC.1